MYIHKHVGIQICTNTHIYIYIYIYTYVTKLILNVTKLPHSQKITCDL